MVIQTFRVPTSGTGDFWYVCDINGANKSITSVNTIVSEAPGAVFANEKNTKVLAIADNTITTWYWTYGDGNTSSEQNPTHSYSDAGNYTVSLTVSDGQNGDTETKTDFIAIYPVDVNDMIKGESFRIYPNPNNGRFIFEIENPSNEATSIEISGINGQIIYTEVNYTAGKVVKELDLTKYGKGVYFVKVQNSEMNNVYKLVIN